MTERRSEPGLPLRLGLFDGKRGDRPHDACGRSPFFSRGGDIVRGQLGEVGVVRLEEFRVVDAAVQAFVMKVRVLHQV